MKAIVVMDEAAGMAGMKLVERPEPDAARFASLSGASYGDVIVRVHCIGIHRGRADVALLPGPIASDGIGHRRSPATRWPEWSPPSAMAQPACRRDNGCSASRTGPATALSRSM